MKKSEITVGGIYYTLVSDELVKVRVIRETNDYRTGRTKYEVARVDTGKALPKYRTPAALRCIP